MSSLHRIVLRQSNPGPAVHSHAEGYLQGNAMDYPQLINSDFVTRWLNKVANRRYFSIFTDCFVLLGAVKQTRCSLIHVIGEARLNS